MKRIALVVGLTLIAAACGESNESNPEPLEERFRSERPPRVKPKSNVTYTPKEESVWAGAIRARINHISESDRDMVERAISVLERACSGIEDHLDDVVESSVSITDYDTDAYAYEKRGWTRSVEVELRFSEKPKTFDDPRIAWGHTVFFSLGGGTDPGVLTTKRIGAHLCLRDTNTSPTFVSASNLGFIK